MTRPAWSRTGFPWRATRGASSRNGNSPSSVRCSQASNKMSTIARPAEREPVRTVCYAATRLRGIHVPGRQPGWLFGRGCLSARARSPGTPSGTVGALETSAYMADALSASLGLSRRSRARRAQTTKTSPRISRKWRSGAPSGVSSRSRAGVARSARDRSRARPARHERRPPPESAWSPALDLPVKRQPAGGASTRSTGR
jgi:hypothetical protein